MSMSDKNSDAANRIEGCATNDQPMEVYKNVLPPEPPSDGVRIEHDRFPDPLPLEQWVESNKHKLAPPVGNVCMIGKAESARQFTVMIIGGPNQRTDYHLNDGDEWFWQLKGDMVLKVIDGGVFKDITIKEGECFLLPGRVPHSPQRFEGTIGMVIERDRHHWLNELDGLRWYCPNPECRRVVHEAYFKCKDLGIQLVPVIKGYFASETLRTCKYCGHVDKKTEGVRKDHGTKVHPELMEWHESRNIDPKRFPPPRKLTHFIGDMKGEQQAQKMIQGHNDFHVRLLSDAGHDASKGAYITSESCEFYHSVKGKTCLSVKDGDEFREVVIGEGDVYMVAPHVPHIPLTCNDKDTIGLVVSRQPVKSREKTESNSLRWFCKKCNALIYQDSYDGDPFSDGADIIRRFFAEDRFCGKCGEKYEISTAH